tara:strand:- start:90 stop:347 length:258 start_codon:yes stop_codon:yes gene_type:complete
MLVHLPRGNKLSSKDNATLYTINALIKGLGKHGAKKKIAEPGGKKVRAQLLVLFEKLNKHLDNSYMKKNNRNTKKVTNKRVRKRK